MITSTKVKIEFDVKAGSLEELYEKGRVETNRRRAMLKDQGYSLGFAIPQFGDINVDVINTVHWTPGEDRRRGGWGYRDVLQFSCAVELSFSIFKREPVVEHDVELVDRGGAL